ncbi:MAG: rRNA ((967)-C(5))-methyltransferase RsmB, partial [Pseudomonadota bacterium]
MNLKPDSLAFALSGAASTLVFVEGGMALPRALIEVFESSRATPGARGAIQD